MVKIRKRLPVLISKEIFDSLDKKYDELGAKIYKLYENWKTL